MADTGESMPRKTTKVCRGCGRELPIKSFDVKLRTEVGKWTGKRKTSRHYAAYCLSCDQQRFRERMARRATLPAPTIEPTT